MSAGLERQHPFCVGMYTHGLRDFQVHGFRIADITSLPLTLSLFQLLQHNVAAKPFSSVAPSEYVIHISRPLSQ